MAQEITFEKAAEKDILALIEIEKSVAGPVTYSPMLTEEEWKEEMRAGAVFSIKEGEQVVGSVSYVEHPGRLYISGVVVKPECQGRGIARAALEHVLAEHAGAPRVDLVVHPDNASALRLYQSLGFEIESRRENYYGDDQPRLIMALRR